MPKQFQEKLLNFLDSGRIKIDQQQKQYDFDIKGAKVFATPNNRYIRAFMLHTKLIHPQAVCQMDRRVQ